LTSDPNPTVRAAAAAALFGQESAAAALSTAATGDAEASVRAAAIGTLTSIKPADFDAVVCGALLDDAAPEVRVAALGAMRATRDPEQLACLTARMAREETSPEVRAALLKTLQSTSAPEASKALCDGIPAWVRMYVKDTAPSEGDDILKAQNNRDFENSYACAAAAAKQAGGYTCAGKEYVGAFFRDVGGKGGPSCRAGGKKSASNEVEF
ncbi:MAG: HEAT repeat domain-containing protein, partial [Myxococcota bacterium]